MVRWGWTTKKTHTGTQCQKQRRKSRPILIVSISKDVDFLAILSGKLYPFGSVVQRDGLQQRCRNRKASTTNRISGGPPRCLQTDSINSWTATTGRWSGKETWTSSFSLMSHDQKIQSFQNYFCFFYRTRN